MRINGRLFNVLICDDEKDVCSFVEEVLAAYGKLHGINIKTEIFYTGSSVLEYISWNRNVDLLFLDIMLPDQKGDQIGKIIREEFQNEELQIVYISAKEKYAMQLFKTRPFDFLIKPFGKDMIVDVFEKYRKLSEKHPQFFEYKVGKRMEKILFSKIMYFMCAQRKICIVTENQEIYFYGSMKELRKQLGADVFWSVHASFIVNIRYVKQFKEKEIVMCNNFIIPISNAYKKEVKNKLILLDEDR